MSDQLHTPAALLQRKKPPYALDRRLSGPQCRSGRRGEETILYPTRDSNSDPSIVQPVASRYADYANPADGYHCNVESRKQ
jgi:hypothetical protein